MVIYFLLVRVPDKRCTEDNSKIIIPPIRKHKELLLSLRRWHWHYTLKFYVNVFYAMGKVLSGELSCTGKGLVFLISQ